MNFLFALIYLLSAAVAWLIISMLTRGRDYCDRALHLLTALTWPFWIALFFTLIAASYVRDKIKKFFAWLDEDVQPW